MMAVTELEVFSIFVFTVENCTVLNITKDFRILADKLGTFNKNLEQSMDKSGYSPAYFGNSGFSEAIEHWNISQYPYGYSNVLMPPPMSLG